MSKILQKKIFLTSNCIKPFHQIKCIWSTSFYLNLKSEKYSLNEPICFVYIVIVALFRKDSSNYELLNN